MIATSDVLPVVMPASGVPGPAQGCWTYADYAALPDEGGRFEIVDGVLYMTPAPGTAHQAAVGEFFGYLREHVYRSGHGRVFVAPIDVALAPTVVVQPDVTVVLSARAAIITPEGIAGAPDLVVEVVSPGTAGYDRRAKQDAYARAGVPEYWVADPAARTVEVLQLEQGSYRALGVYRGKARLPSKVVPDLPVAVEQFFA